MANHERRHTGELCSSRTDQTSCDANNNPSVETSVGTAQLADSVAQQAESNSSRANQTSTRGSKTLEESNQSNGENIKRQQQQQEATTLLRSSESNCSESDDWHLLDADEHSLSSSSSVSSHQEFGCGHSNASDSDKKQQKRPKRNMTQPKMGEQAKLNKNTPKNNNNNNNNNSDHDYVDFEPPNRDQLSPALVYICTVIYSLMPLASLLAFFTLICLLFTKLWFITIVYYTYVLFDSNTCNRGGRRWSLVYRAKFWSYIAAYFPIKLRYSNRFKLDPNENYILNYHPHGISAFGCVAAFATNGLNFSRLFPGLKARFMVHETSFLVPIMRETFSLRGDCSVNSKSFDYILEKRWQIADGAGGAPSLTSQQETDARGNLLALCGGGLAEADLSNMETLKIVCATRKGFVKKSLIHGAHLIPCIAFGENSVFRKVNLKPGSLLYKLEKSWYQLFKFKHPIYYGRSLIFGDRGKGSVPYKRPITVVMGDPIQVKRVPEPSQEQIDELHSKYMHSLKSIYEDNKQQLCEHYDTKLELV